MERRPFDPARMAARRAATPKPAAADPARPLSVSELAEIIGTVVRDRLPTTIRVVGEVSGFRERTHWYFDLKDGGAVVNCIVFAGAAARMGFTPADGQEVVVSGRVELYAKQGRLSFRVSQIQPVGAGAQELAYRRLCEELRALGWFDEDRKRPIPTFPKRVAVVTSRTGAALQDVLDTMRKRCCAVELALVDVRVQGDMAAAEIAQAVRWLGRRRRELDIDAILITRGGGSAEDLWAFNDRGLAEAIVRSPVPVVAAIGHETDTTIAELVADLRCATPTQAATKLSPEREALSDQVESATGDLRAVMSRLLRGSLERVHRAERHPALADPGRMLRGPRERLARAVKDVRRAQEAALLTGVRRVERLSGRLDGLRPQAVHARSIARLNELRLRLDAAVRYRFACVDVEDLGRRLTRAAAGADARRAVRLEAVARQLEAVGPESVLRRGFSYTQLETGELVRSAAQVRPGELVRTTVADGQFTSRVTPSTAPTPAGVASPPKSVAAVRARSRTGARKADTQGDAAAAAAQMDLFDGGR